MSLALLCHIINSASQSPHAPEYWYLLWYVPNWTASALILFPRISDTSRDNQTVLRVLFWAALISNLVVTVLYLPLRWVGVAPAVVTICLALACELQIREKIKPKEF